MPRKISKKEALAKKKREDELESKLAQVIQKKNIEIGDYLYTDYGIYRIERITKDKIYYTQRNKNGEWKEKGHYNAHDFL